MPTYGKEIHDLYRALDAVRTDSDDMPTQQVLCLFAIALRPGITMEQLGRQVGISQSSCSRNVSALSERHRLDKPGAGYIEAHKDPSERRRKIMYLTAKGRQVVTKALEALHDGPVDFEAPTFKEAWSGARRRS